MTPAATRPVAGGVLAAIAICSVLATAAADDADRNAASAAADGNEDGYAVDYGDRYEDLGEDDALLEFLGSFGDDDGRWVDALALEALFGAARDGDGPPARDASRRGDQSATGRADERQPTHSEDHDTMAEKQDHDWR